MMQRLLHTILRAGAFLISLVFHPVFIPVYTVWLYFHLTSRFFLPANRHFLILYLTIVSIIIPLLFFGVILRAKGISGYCLQHPRERLLFSVIILVVYTIIFSKIIKYHQFIELYPFFFGIILSVLTLALFNYFYKKPSIHTLALTGSIVFFIIWSYYSQLNILNYLSVMIIIATLVIAARVYSGAHDFKEIVQGIAIGILMQLVGFYLTWLFF